MIPSAEQFQEFDFSSSPKEGVGPPLLPQPQKPSSGSPAKNWKTEQVYFEGDDFFRDLCQDIQKAKHSINFEVYIFANDLLGNRISKLLEEAALRGVNVKIIVDGFGSPLWKYTFQSRLTRAGVKCKIYHRIPFNLFAFFPMIFTRFQFLFEHLERRNHRKLFLIDNETAYLGSMNVAAYHLAEFHGKNAWRDTGTRVTGAAVTSLLDAFECSWKSSLFHYPRIKKISSLVRVYNSQRRKHLLYSDFLHRIEKSKTRVWLTTAYFVPTGAFLRRLKHAAARKVDVRILTTGKTDMWIIRWMRSAFYIALLKAGARVFEYQPAVLHAKSALLDDFCMVGSTNLNNRSFFHDQEVDIVLQKSRQLLEERFLLDLANSREITLGDWEELNWLTRALSKFSLLFRKWL